ncbi:MAG: diguanylate cyclase [Lysobacterales bacterium]
MLRASCLALLLCLTPQAHGDSDQFESLLAEADAVRSSDAGKFSLLLDRLDAISAEASVQQRQHLRYLQAYRLALAGDFQGAIRDLKVLFDEATDVSLRFQAGAFLVNNFAATREFAEGLAYLDQTLALLPEISDQQLRQQNLIGAMVLYNQVGQYDLALHYADMVLAEPTSGRTRCKAEFMRLEALFNQAALPADDQQFTDRIQRCLEEGEVLVAGFIRGYLARKWDADGRTAEAVSLLQQHLAEVEATRYPRLIGEIHSLLAQYEYKLGHAALAEGHARQAIAQSAGIAFSLPLVLAYKTLYDTAIERGDTTAALEHYRNYAEADKAYLDATKARELAVQLAKHETLQKTQTIELLNRQNQVLQLEQKVSKQAATNTQLVLALVLLLLASLAFWAYRIKRVQMALKRMAETDALTGVSNRGHFTERAGELLQASERKRRAVSLIMFDLDLFKRINDHFGHATGDWVLRQVASVSKSAVTGKDVFGRIGGEEFAILRPDCDLDCARELATKLRERIAGIDGRANGASFQVSASFGVSSSADSGYDLDRLLAHADHALYASKHAGRNRVYVYDSSMAELEQVP